MSYESKPGRLVVCERTGRWALALRRELAGVGIRVWETRILEDCGALLTQSPASFVILELEEKRIKEFFDSIVNLQDCFPRFRFAVVADRSLSPYQWLMREAGAVDFICSIRRIAPLAQTACRHLAQIPPLPQNLTDRIWASLPWSRISS